MNNGTRIMGVFKEDNKEDAKIVDDAWIKADKHPKIGKSCSNLYLCLLILRGRETPYRPFSFLL